MSKIIGASVIKRDFNFNYKFFRIKEEKFKILLSKKYDFECFIGKPPYKFIDFNSGEEGDENVILLNDLFLKQKIEDVTLEKLREFSYLTSGDILFIFYADNGEECSFRITDGKLERVKILSKRSGKVGEELFV